MMRLAEPKFPEVLGATRNTAPTAHPRRGNMKNIIMCQKESPSNLFKQWLQLGFLHFLCL